MFGINHFNNPYASRGGNSLELGCFMIFGYVRFVVGVIIIFICDARTLYFPCFLWHLPQKIFRTVHGGGSAFSFKVLASSNELLI